MITAPFDLAAGDCTRRTWSAAIALADDRARETNTRQRVYRRTLHTDSRLPAPALWRCHVWIVQAVR